MKQVLNKSDLIDLIGERSAQLRKRFDHLWSEKHDIPISTSESFILKRIKEQNLPTISQISKSLDISRQAAHKMIKNLEAKGLVEVVPSRTNNKAKCLQLTTIGEECHNENELLKLEIEESIAQKVGNESLNLLKKILESDWGISNE